ncbi:hypothetical protein FB446DRAFT_725557 [Lentinula raphanica]|nr:hypothetical protein FB446DRAFT_725557 [Lentinula raphanica]
MRPILAHFLTNRYPEIKAEHPGKGRRYWQLCALHEFWASNPTGPGDNEPSTSPTESAMNSITEDDDPCDVILSDVAGGIVLRTDYTNDEAWKAFVAELEGTESNIAPESGQENVAEESSSATDVDMGDAAGEGPGDDSDEDEELKLFKIVNPTQSEERAVFQDISNLRALRLLNDVDIRPAPPVPAQSKRISPPNPLVDFAGWQEVYTGVTLWIYDTQSNIDQSARLVSPEGDVYGTATGDSWRAKVSHIPHLQLDMTFENMKINFGGMDRWDYSERKRNLAEAILKP